MLELKNRIYISIVVMLILLLTGCESLTGFNDEVQKDESVFLTIELDKPYSVEKLFPGRGNFRYDSGTIAEIKLITNPGYEFLGWAGVDGGDVVKVSDQNYKLTMLENKRIRTNFLYNNFLLLKIEFDNLIKLMHDDINDIIEIPHIIEEIALNFNNKISLENDISALIKDPEKSTGEPLLIEDLKIEFLDNKLVIHLEPWLEDFIKLYFEENENNEENEINIEFEKEYILDIKSNFANNIFDSGNKEYNEEIISLSFQIEEPRPKNPEIIGLSKDNGDVEISWHRTESVTKFAVEDYVEEYIIQRSRNNKDFEDNIIEISVAVDLFDESERPVKIHRYIDSEINLNNNIYYYRVIAVNQFDNKSEPSDIRSTESLN